MTIWSHFQMTFFLENSHHECVASKYWFNSRRSIYTPGHAVCRCCVNQTTANRKYFRFAAVLYTRCASKIVAKLKQPSLRLGMIVDYTLFALK